MLPRSGVRVMQFFPILVTFVVAQKMIHEVI